MKKILLLLTLALLVLALVACGGEKPPVDTDPVVTTDPAVTTKPTSTFYTVTFLDAAYFPDAYGDPVVIDEQQVKRNGFAKEPSSAKMIDHPGYVFVGWDAESLTNVKSDLTVNAIYRQVDTYTVEFYDGETLLGSVKVKEGEAAVFEAPSKTGHIFRGWDKGVSEVNRNWADFDAYREMSEEEIANTNLVFKVNAIYEALTGTIPYKENITFGLKGYAPADPIFNETSFTYVEYEPGKGFTGKNVAAEDKYNKVQMTASYAWDGEYIYTYIVAKDETLIDMGKAYCEGEADPWSNDNLEVWYSVGEEFTSESQKRFLVDAFKHRVSTPENLMSVYYDEIVATIQGAVDKANNTYYLMFKMPAKTEAGVALVAGDIYRVAYQIDDIRSKDDPTGNIYCSSSNHIAYEDGCEKFDLGEK